MVCLASILLLCAVPLLHAAPTFFTDASHRQEIPVPGISLEGPYLSDANNSGPYVGDLNNDGLPDIAVSPWGTGQGHTAEPARYIVAFYNRSGRFRCDP